MNLDSLVRMQVAVLFEQHNGLDQLIFYEWSQGQVTKKSHRKSSNVILEVKFCDGKRDVDVSRLTYNEDWVLLSERREGAQAAKQTKKKKDKKKKKKK